MNRTIIIGDVHGCYDELVALLEKCERKPSDEVVSIGDMVDRGPKPCEVVEFFQMEKMPVPYWVTTKTSIFAFGRGVWPKPFPIHYKETDGHAL